MAHGNLQWSRWWWKDWNNDMKYFGSSFRCVWFTILGAIWENGVNGVLTTSAADLAKYSGLEKRLFDRQIPVISRSDVGHFTFHENGTFTVTSRRIARDLSKREAARNRKARSRAKSQISHRQRPRGQEKDNERVEETPQRSPELVAKGKRIYVLLVEAWDRYLGLEYKAQRKDWKQIYSLAKLCPSQRVKQMIDFAFGVVNNPVERNRWIKEVTAQSLLYHHKRILTELRRIEKEEDDVI